MSAWYYNMFIILMSVFMGMGGILLTALAYRPKQITEDWWEWTNRFYESGQDNQTYRRESPVITESCCQRPPDWPGQCCWWPAWCCSVPVWAAAC